MEEDELFAALRLQAVPHIGAVMARKLIDRFGSPSGIFDRGLHEIRKQPGIGRKITNSLADKIYALKAEKELQYLRRSKHKYWYYQGQDYPALLRHCPDAPILLFRQGNIQLQGPVISIVGTRQMTTYGKEVCRELIMGIRHLNPVIVSGFAYGVDICAHQFAMDAGLQTIACLAHGLDRTYPADHRKYRGSLLEKGGFLTEFWSRTRPERENFLKRNRIIAGISHTTVVIESGEKGGSLITADLAMGYNRDVFAVPGRLTDIQSRGCNELIGAHKAQIFHSADDLIKQMNWENRGQEKPVQLPLFPDLSAEEKVVFEHLKSHPREHLDMISVNTGYPVSKTSSILLTLEIKGLINPLPGKRFDLAIQTSRSVIS